MKRAGIALGVLLAVLGCASAPPAEKAARPDAGWRFHDDFRVLPRMWFEWGDGATNVGRGPYRLVIDNYDMPIRQNRLDELRDRLTLVTWPEGEPVETDVTTTEMIDDRPGVGDPLGYVGLMPRKALETRWYAFRLASVPGDLSLLPGAFAPAPGPDDSFYSRFRPDSHPHPALLVVCPKGGPTVVSVRIVFSEPVRTDRPGADPISLEVPGATCGLQDDLASAAGLPEIRWSCAGSGASLFRVRIRDLAGIGGEPLRSSADAALPLEFELVSAAMTTTSDGCAYARL